MSTKVKEWTVLSMLEWATDFFEEKSIPDPRHSIEWLLAETLNVKRLDLYLKFDRPLSTTELDKLRPLVKRRSQHEPLQYIVGFSDFMNARISVTEDVLIPRLETEQLVEIILDHHSSSESCSVLDIGTGSGCIPIALKMERPQWTVAGVDISVKALKIARKNAEENNVSIDFSEADVLNSNTIHLDTPQHVIVSNPPYIHPEEKKELEPQVRDYEPHSALFFDDLEQMYGRIITFAEDNLVTNGSLYLELHERYADDILNIFDGNKWATDLQKDYDQKPRFIIASLI